MLCMHAVDASLPYALVPAMPCRGHPTRIPPFYSTDCIHKKKESVSLVHDCKVHAIWFIRNTTKKRLNPILVVVSYKPYCVCMAHSLGRGCVNLASCPPLAVAPSGIGVILSENIETPCGPPSLGGNFGLILSRI